MRRVLAGALAWLLPLGMAGSPFLHLHLDGGDADHHGHTMHAHAGGHDGARPGPGHPEVDGDEHGRTMAVPLFVAVSPDAHAAAALPAVPRTADRPLAPGPRTRPLVAHGHDPPASRLLPVRAPPRPAVLI